MSNRLFGLVRQEEDTGPKPTVQPGNLPRAQAWWREQGQTGIGVSCFLDLVRFATV